MSEETDDYINIERRYKKEKDDSFWGSSITLREIIESEMNILILGDPGAGKTTEIIHMNKTLNEEGKTSFFLRLQDASCDNFSKDFCDYVKQSDAFGYIFLDSIDECLLSANIHENPFQSALKNIFQKINAPKKFKFIYTSRRNNLNDTKGVLTKHLIEIFSSNSKLSVYEMQSLTYLDIKTIAEKYLDKDSSKIFLDNMDKWEDFCQLPIDCIDTIKYFYRNGDFPQDIKKFLKTKTLFYKHELNEKHPQELSLSVIDFFAKRAAATNILLGNPSFFIRKTYSKIQGVELLELFPDNTSNSLKCFLDSNLFSDNGEDTRKFRNEQIKNYYAYLWFSDRFEHNKPMNVRKILRHHKMEFPDLSLFSVVSMLCNDDREMRSEIILKNPEILFLYPEYCELTTKEKNDIISNLFTNYSYRTNMLFKSFSCLKKATRRFYEKNISENISNLYLLSNDDSEKIILLFLIKNFSEKDFSSELISELKKDLHQNKQIEEDILKTFISIKSTLFLDEIKEYTNTNIEIYPDIVYEITEKLYPKFFNLYELLKLFGKIESHDLWIFRVFIQETLLNDITSAVNAAEILIRFYKEEGKETYLLCCLSILDALQKDISAEEISDFLIEIQTSMKKEKYFQIDRKIIFSDEIRKSFLKKLLKSQKELNTFLLFMYPYAIICFDVEKDSSMLLDLVHDKSIDESIRTELFKQLARRNPEVFENIAFNEETKSYLLALKKSLLAPIVFEENDSTKASKEIQNKEQEIERKNKEYVLNYINKIREGDETLLNLTVYLYHIYSNDDLSSTDFEKTDQIKENDLTGAIKQGLKKYWKNTSIKFDTLLDSPHIPIQVYLSLKGIMLDFEEGTLIQNNENIDKLLILALHELNKFPCWFENILKNREYQIRFVSIIKNLLSVDADRNLYKLRYLSKETKNSISEKLCEILIEKNFNASLGLNDVVNTVLYSDIDYDKKKKVAQIILDKYKETQISDIVFDIFICMPDVFLNYADDKKDSLKSILDMVLSHHYDLDFRNWRLSEDLLRLLSLFYNIYPPENDPVHKKTVFTPDNLDDAARMRGILFQQLESCCCSSEFLRNKAKEISNQNFKKRLLFLAEQCDIQNEEAYTVNDIVDFEETDYIEPKSSLMFYELVKGKVIDIKNDIEFSDYSLIDLYRELLLDDKSEKDSDRKYKKEKFFQKHLLKELRIRSKNLYAAVREVEVINGKKPDLQIWNKGWCVNIECKIADWWTYDQLHNALENQLLGQYLKHPNYRNGILLLAHFDKKRWNKNKRTLNIDELCEDLQKHALSLKEKHPHIQNLDILVIKYHIKD